MGNVACDKLVLRPEQGRKKKSERKNQKARGSAADDPEQG
jgi:hypothetical protein